MTATLQEFRKNKKYLLCVDSDGCAMDTMNVKHFRCFGPCFADVYGFTENRQKVLGRWNQINLFEITRGINRFLGFATILAEIYPNDGDIKEFYAWTKNAKELSEKAVLSMYEQNGNEVFYKAYIWSQAVNKSINELDENDKQSFDGVKECLAYAREYFDVAIVSSANYSAVAEEWARCGLLQLTDVVTTQTDGSKAHCIAELLNKGYDKQNVIMCGDAEGDLRAADVNGVMFYPILVNKESESWRSLPVFLQKFVSNECSLDFTEFRKEFYKNLGAD